MKYQIKGEPMPVVICHLESGETVTCESGAMCWMSPNMEMETEGGGLGKMFGRMLSGENLFQNHYQAKHGPGMIAFASSFPGSIRAFEITPSAPIICQKKAFLASSSGVELSTYFQKKMSTGLFGGEGFIMQKISGNGVVFLEIDGSTVEYDLEPGQQMVVDTGYLAMMDASVKMEIQAVKGVKNALFGGEGAFNTVVTGPGRVLLQTMPISGFAALIASLIPSKNGWSSITVDFYQEDDSLVCELYTSEPDQTAVFRISRIDKVDIKDLSASENINEITVEQIEAELEPLMKLFR